MRGSSSKAVFSQRVSGWWKLIKTLVNPSLSCPAEIRVGLGRWKAVIGQEDWAFAWSIRVATRVALVPVGIESFLYGKFYQ